MTYASVGEAALVLGGHPKAVQAFAQAIPFWENFIRHHPTAPAYRWNLALTHMWLALALMQTRAPRQEVEQSFRQAVALTEQVTREFPHRPTYQHEPAQSQSNLAWFLLTGPDP